MKITNEKGANPTLKAGTPKKGVCRLLLHYELGRQETPMKDAQGNVLTYENGRVKYKITRQRKDEYLELYVYDKPKTTPERQHNEKVLAVARKVRFEKEQAMKQARNGYRLPTQMKINFYDYFQCYIDHYTKKDVRMVRYALREFREFIEETHPEFKTFIRPEDINTKMIRRFAEWMQPKHKGEGADSVFSRFKKVCRHAWREDKILQENPCEGVVIKTDTEVLKKDILSMEEIKTLIATKVVGQNQTMRRAFIFCLLTGIRFCDVKELTYRNVDYSNRLLSFEQDKTKGHSRKSHVTIPLNDTHIKLIGEGKKDSLIFPLPTHNACLHALKHWVKRAGIDKHITWHCARHSFAVNILNNGANIKTVASLLGHSGLQHTEKYTRAIDELKQKAIDSIDIDL